MVCGCRHPTAHSCRDNLLFPRVARFRYALPAEPRRQRPIFQHVPLTLIPSRILIPRPRLLLRGIRLTTLSIAVELAVPRRSQRNGHRAGQRPRTVVGRTASGSDGPPPAPSPKSTARRSRAGQSMSFYP